MVNADRLLIPYPSVYINRRGLAEAEPFLYRVTVSTEIDVPGMFALELVNFDRRTGKVRWSDEKLFNIGNRVEIKMDRSPGELLIDGEITGLEPEFSEDAVPTLVVRGYDRRHRLMRGQKTRSFVKMKDSEIAKQIAQEAGLKIVTTDTTVVLEYVLQQNQSDLEFLQKRASRIGYELTIQGQVLGFHPITQSDSPSPIRLTFLSELTRFSPRLSSLNQVDEVEIRSSNRASKEPVVSRSNPVNLPEKMGLRQGAKEAQTNFGKASRVWVDQPVASVAEAGQIAQGQFWQMALNYITGEGQCLGIPRLHAGRLVNIQGVGTRFSGKYYVTAATHTFGSEQPYVTEFSFKRSAHNL